MLARMGHDSCTVKNHIDEELIFPTLEKWAPSSTTSMPHDAKPSTKSQRLLTHMLDVCAGTDTVRPCLGFLRACVLEGRQDIEECPKGQL